MAALYMGYDTAYGNYGRIVCGVRGLRAGNIYIHVCVCGMAAVQEIWFRVYNSDGIYR